MITGFEEETCPLNDAEKKMTPLIVKGLYERHGEDRAITSAEICKAMKQAGYKLTAARLRKIINFIRIEGIIGDLVATSKGYYRESDPVKIAKYIESLRERAAAINAVADSMEKITIAEDGQSAIKFEESQH